jgi:hypothetical protein
LAETGGIAATVRAVLLRGAGLVTVVVVALAVVAGAVLGLGLVLGLVPAVGEADGVGRPDDVGRSVPELAVHPAVVATSRSATNRAR